MKQGLPAPMTNDQYVADMLAKNDGRSKVHKSQLFKKLRGKSNGTPQIGRAVIDGQGKIPYKGERESFAEAPMDVPDGVARGMGAAKRGGNYKGIK
jgi:hypothetical protein